MIAFAQLLLFCFGSGSFSCFVCIAVSNNSFFFNNCSFFYNFGSSRFFSGIAISFGVATIAREERNAHNNSKR